MNDVLRVAVPPGVGDVYWALTKLRSFKERHGYGRTELYVQKTRLTRALEWAEMIDFVDDARELKFQPDPLAITKGYSRGLTRNAEHCFWPNAVVDRGDHLREWLPEYDLDLDFEVRVEEPSPDRAGRAVVYHSSAAIHEAWFPQLNAQWWNELIMQLSGEVLTATVGAFWDLAFRTHMKYDSSVLDLLTQTNLKQVAGILREAKVVVGVISGMTILANHFKTPCIALCPNKFPDSFPQAWVKPDAPYIVLMASEIRSPEQVRELALSIARKS